MKSKELIIKILNCFETGKPETDYFSIFLYKDGPNNSKQVTLGRGYTEQGSLWDVFEEYKKLNGKNAEELLSYKKYKGDESLPQNKNFLNLIINTAKTDENFKNAQDLTFDKLYWNKGYNWFLNNEFKYDLSLAVVQDSILHSGSMPSFLTNRFSEKTPKNGGNEKKWIKQYVDTRKKWLQTHTRKILNNTVYRQDFFIEQLKNNNWELVKFPIYPNGIKIDI